jgi:hypothetical protein
LEKSCRLEGLLETVINRGKDLQKELEENSKIEESIRKEIEADLQVEPNHPVITEAPRMEELLQAGSRDACDPTTPGSGKCDSSQPCLHTPEVSPDSFIITGQPADLHDYENGAFPFSPNSIDNADISGPGLPSYRRRATESYDETGYAYGCGAAILGNGVHLFTSGDPPGNALLEGAHGGTGYRDRSNSSDHPGLGPTLTSSFDTIDFRTGMSGHRGLNNAKLNPGHSPTPRGMRLMMSEHRGIGRARGPLQRSSASNSPS